MEGHDLKKKVVVSICTGTGGLAAGATRVIEAFEQAFHKFELEGRIEPRIHKVGCKGFCTKDLLVDVTVDGETTTYQYVTPEKVPVIVEEHILGGEPVTKWVVKEDYKQFQDKQQKLILKDCGRIVPESIDEYLWAASSCSCPIPGTSSY